MKAVILAGGRGTRLAEETGLRPKPMVEIGGRPILWHIMKLYERHGITDFIICLGYRGWQIKEYFLNYRLHSSDIALDLATGQVEVLRPAAEPWRITLVDTGEDSMTGGRLKRVAPHLGNETFCMTYGDGVADIDINAIVAHHRRTGLKATVTAVPSPGRFGILDLGKSDLVTRFHEKPENEMGYINGGFFVLEPSVIDHIAGDSTTWEREPLERLAQEGQLSAYRHAGFWRPMDALRDKRDLEALWDSGSAPWKRW